ncbi:hypothetical protein [Litchfieldia salsa]|uniref:Uncharacterized protein n=1 Tax=Litchfieldia salsa TaxID=930152 RepID=A0A1H0VZ44_9BACI|nr:hypothetical protein [Litchfieldia salsa]SDP83563.1 hypothetical protein SAMN05216565_10889 [Litchfieldia salsa]
MREIFNLITPTGPVLLGAFLIFFIPFMTFKIKQKVYEMGNQTWKKHEEKQGEE